MAGMPPEDAGAPAHSEQSEMDSPEQAISMVEEALTKLSQMPGLEGLADVADHFRQVVQDAAGGGSGPQPEAAGAQTMEQGGSKARPMSMGG